MKLPSYALIILTASFAISLHADMNDFGALDDHNVCNEFDGKKICTTTLYYSDVEQIKSTVQFLFDQEVETIPFYNDRRLERQNALEKALYFTSHAKQVDSINNLPLTEITALYNAIHDRVQTLIIMYLKSPDREIRRSAIEYFNSMRSLTENYRYPTLFAVLNEDSVQTAYTEEANKEINAIRSEDPNAARFNN